MKLGRNDMCWCGSGKKYKTCHLALDDKLEDMKNSAEVSDDSFSAMQLYVADKFTAADNITESGYYTYVARYLGIDEDN